MRVEWPQSFGLVYGVRAADAEVAVAPAGAHHHARAGILFCPFRIETGTGAHKIHIEIVIISIRLAN